MLPSTCCQNQKNPHEILSSWILSFLSRKGPVFERAFTRIWRYKLGCLRSIPVKTFQFSSTSKSKDGASLIYPSNYMYQASMIRTHNTRAICGFYETILGNLPKNSQLFRYSLAILTVARDSFEKVPRFSSRA